MPTMNSPPILDFDRLTRPIDGGQPTGPDLRTDPSPVSAYYQIKDARAAARAAERAGTQVEQGQQVVSAEWNTVLRLAPEVLATKTKDLEIVAWLVEALLRAHGFAGLRDGFRLLRELVDKFWDGLHPMPDEDGIATRVAPLTGLSGGDSAGTLSVPIAMAPITRDGEFGTFGLWRYAKARDLAKNTDPAALNEAMAAGAATLEQFEATVRSTDPNFLRCLAGDVDAAIEHFTALTALLDAKCGADSPPSSSIRNLLLEAKQTIQHVIRDIAGIVLEAEEPAKGEAAADGAAAAAPAKSAGGSQEIRTREDAFKAISKVADFFRATEPHSPVASVLDQAVRWGRLPLAQLIEELIPDSTARDHFGLLTGLRSKPADAPKEG